MIIFNYLNNILIIIHSFGIWNFKIGTIQLFHQWHVGSTIIRTTTFRRSPIKIEPRSIFHLRKLLKRRRSVLFIQFLFPRTIENPLARQFSKSLQSNSFYRASLENRFENRSKSRRKRQHVIKGRATRLALSQSSKETNGRNASLERESRALWHWQLRTTTRKRAAIFREERNVHRDKRNLVGNGDIGASVFVKREIN